jgi:hypothetical protein
MADVSEYRLDINSVPTAKSFRTLLRPKHKGFHGVVKIVD